MLLKYLSAVPRSELHKQSHQLERRVPCVLTHACSDNLSAARYVRKAIQGLVTVGAVLSPKIPARPLNQKPRSWRTRAISSPWSPHCFMEKLAKYQQRHQHLWLGTLKISHMKPGKYPLHLLQLSSLQFLNEEA